MSTAMRCPVSESIAFPRICRTDVFFPFLHLFLMSLTVMMRAKRNKRSTGDRSQRPVVSHRIVMSSGFTVQHHT